MTDLTEKSLGSAEARSERLRFLREEVLRASRAEMEHMTGISDSSIANWEYDRYSGLTDSGAKRIEEACKKLGINCTAKWLLFGTGKAPSATLMTGESLTDLSDLNLTQEETIAEELKVFHRLNKNAVDFIMQDDSMLPFFRPHDVLAGIQHFSSDIEKAINQVCIVKTLTGQTSVRLLQKSNEVGHYFLSCSNLSANAATPAEEATKLFSAAPVLWLRRKSLL
jgi:hypothetical protein